MRLACLIALLLPSLLHAQPRADTLDFGGPVIDLHVHTGAGSAASRYYPVAPDETPDAARHRFLLADLDAHGVVLALLSGPPTHTLRWADAAPERFVASVSFPCTGGRDPNNDACFAGGGDWPDLDSLQRWAAGGRLGALGELYNVYAGVAPDDPRMAPYYALAAEHDLIVAAHADSGPPPQARTPGCCPHFEEAYASPAHYRPLLAAHPTLRLYLMHALRPDFVEEAIALMDAYPNVVVDTSPMSRVPEPAVHASLRRLVAAGHADRIVFGSDYLGAIGPSLAVIARADFLTPEQKRAIYYGNAARFLRLAPEVVARHHAAVAR